MIAAVLADPGWCILAGAVVVLTVGSCATRGGRALWRNPGAQR